MKGTGINDLQDQTSTSGQPPVDVFTTYVRQRFLLAIYLPLAGYLVLFSKGSLQFASADVLLFVFTLFFLLVMRLYDDLQNASFDLNKPNRIYTNPQAVRTLYIGLAVASVLLIAFVMASRFISGVSLLIFFAANYVLYYLLIHRAGWRHVLPLLKYPFIAAMIVGEWHAWQITLFFAFLTYDLMDDAAFPLPRWTSVVTSMIAFALSIYSVSTNLILIALAMAILTSFLTLNGSKYMAYVFLVMLLIARLIDSLYEI